MTNRHIILIVFAAIVLYLFWNKKSKVKNILPANGNNNEFGQESIEQGNSYVNPYLIIDPGYTQPPTEPTLIIDPVPIAPPKDNAIENVVIKELPKPLEPTVKENAFVYVGDNLTYANQQLIQPLATIKPYQNGHTCPVGYKPDPLDRGCVPDAQYQDQVEKERFIRLSTTRNRLLPLTLRRLR